MCYYSADIPKLLVENRLLVQQRIEHRVESENGWRRDYYEESLDNEERVYVMPRFIAEHDCCRYPIDSWAILPARLPTNTKRSIAAFPALAPERIQNEQYLEHMWKEFFQLIRGVKSSVIALDILMEWEHEAGVSEHPYAHSAIRLFRTLNTTILRSNQDQ